jgi:hypothetical protein
MYLRPAHAKNTSKTRVATPDASAKLTAAK